MSVTVFACPFTGRTIVRQSCSNTLPRKPQPPHSGRAAPAPVLRAIVAAIRSCY